MSSGDADLILRENQHFEVALEVSTQRVEPLNLRIEEFLDKKIWISIWLSELCSFAHVMYRGCRVAELDSQQFSGSSWVSYSVSERIIGCLMLEWSELRRS